MQLVSKLILEKPTEDYFSDKSNVSGIICMAGGAVCVLVFKGLIFSFYLNKFRRVRYFKIFLQNLK